LEAVWSLVPCFWSPIWRGRVDDEGAEALEMGIEGGWSLRDGKC
jgi:hypothetical protein